MANLAGLYVKRAGITALKADAAVVALVPAGRVYPMQRPAAPVWPFVGWGAPVYETFEASCLDGSVLNVAVHVYARTSGSGLATVPGEDFAEQAVAAIAAALGGKSIGLVGAPAPATAHFHCTGAQVIQDGADADAFHGFALFRITVSS